MKIVCECGNEASFDTNGEETEYDEDEGQYATLKPLTLSIWQDHDVVGIYCNKCDKGVWVFA